LHRQDCQSATLRAFEEAGLLKTRIAIAARLPDLATAKTTIASLWKIPDGATMPLMQRFYENLWGKKLSKLDALREAQIWLLKEGRSRGSAIEQPGAKKPASSRLPPRYWAAFVLSGDWR
jgi:CHAT domain-containing protein